MALKRVPGQMLLVRERRIANLDEYLDVLDELRSVHTYSVGWIDALARGRHLGRGILETADHIEDPSFARPIRTLRVPCDLPSGTINGTTGALFNRMYYRRIPATGRERRLDLARFFYPLDSILDWNRMYGRAGFVQLQCVLPDGEARRGIRSLLERVTSTGTASILAVIKTLGSSGRGYLSFPLKGVTLALDFPTRRTTSSLLRALHDITADHGGRVYLAKDSCMTAAHFSRMYPRLGALRNVLRSIDPQRKMRSDMAARLQV
jgi:decaprenylphospho-beta-D-ribofuranose 2-oxidase